MLLAGALGLSLNLNCVPIDCGVEPLTAPGLLALSVKSLGALVLTCDTLR